MQRSGAVQKALEPSLFSPHHTRGWQKDCILLIFGRRPGRDLALHKGSRHIFLRASPGDISRGKQAPDRCFAVRVDPISAGGMAADDIGFGALNFHILHTWRAAAFHPAQSLAGSHVQISLLQLLVLLSDDADRAQIAGAAPLQIFRHRTMHPLRGGDPVFLSYTSPSELICFAPTPCASVPVGAMVSLQRRAIKRISKVVISAPARIPMA